MSSDYISRLRGELLRAGAAHEGRSRRTPEHAGAGGETRHRDASVDGATRPGHVGEGAARRPGRVGDGGERRPGQAGATRPGHAGAGDVTRPGDDGAGGGTRPPRLAGRRRRRSARASRRLRPLAGVVAIALVIAAVVYTLPRERSDEIAVPPATTGQLDYRTAPAESDAAVRILRERLDAAGLRSATVSTVGGEIRVAAPTTDAADVTALMEPGRFGVYYWEGGVLGPDGETAPGDPEVTGGGDAVRVASVTKAEAEERAEGRSDARVLRAESGDGYFALEGAPAITNTGVASARAAVDPTTQQPIVALEFTAKGQRAFQAVTREVAQGGADHAKGAEPLASSHHLAFVVDDRIVSVPYIDWQMNPDGIDGAQGAHISVATADQARLLAAILSTRPLP